MDQPDYILDIQGVTPPGPPEAPNAAGPKHPQPDGKAGSAGGGRPWLAIHWRCCSVYSRVYRNARGTAYEGCCPRCRRMLTVEIGTRGTAARFFEAF